MGVFDIFRKKKKNRRYSFGPDDFGEIEMAQETRYEQVKIRKISVPFEQYLSDIRRTGGFLNLARASDAETAADCAFRTYLGISDFKSMTIRQELTPESLPDMVRFHSNILDREARKVCNSKVKIDQMFLLALQGTLHRKIADETQRATLNPSGGLALDPDSIAGEVATAVDWCTGSSATLMNPRNEDVRIPLRELVHDYVANNRDLFNVDNIDKIDTMTGHKDFVQRPILDVGSEAEYGGTASGRYLQEYVIELAMGLRAGAQAQRERWYDIACFMMVGHIRAQAYPDANHRLSSVLYACIVLQKNLPFAAPNYDLMHKIRTRPTEV
jgi:hypothetical protein